MLFIKALFFIFSSCICFSYSFSCLSLENTICHSSSMLLTPINYSPSLISYFSFDDFISIDLITKNKMEPTPLVGVASGGVGQSAFFNGSYFSEIEHIKEYEGQSFFLEFWLFLLKDSTGNWRTLIQKGETIYDLTPSIMLWPKQRKLHVKVNTADSIEGIDSISIIPLRRWTHISLGYEGKLLQLFINGIKDNEMILKGNVLPNKGRFHLGKDPWHQGTTMYIDELKIWNKMKSAVEMRATVFSKAMGIWGEEGAVFGCESCNYNQALNSCPNNFHLCSIKELFAGGYHVARVMGWLRADSDIWTRDDIPEENKEKDNFNVEKMSICCELK